MEDQDHQENELIEKEPRADLVVDVDVKVKILHTIAKAIYATPIGKRPMQPGRNCVADLSKY